MNKTAWLYCDECGLGFRHFKNRSEAWDAFKVHKDKRHRSVFHLW